MHNNRSETQILTSQQYTPALLSMEINSRNSNRPHAKLIEQLKNQGLALTEEKKLVLPICRQPEPSVFSRFISLLAPGSEPRNFAVESQQKSIYPLEQNYFLVTHCNSLILYCFLKDAGPGSSWNQQRDSHFQTQNSAKSQQQLGEKKIAFKLHSKLHLSDMIDSVIFCSFSSQNQSQKQSSTTNASDVDPTIKSKRKGPSNQTKKQAQPAQRALSSYCIIVAYKKEKKISLITVVSSGNPNSRREMKMMREMKTGAEVTSMVFLSQNEFLVVTKRFDFSLYRLNESRSSFNLVKVSSFREIVSCSEPSKRSFYRESSLLSVKVFSSFIPIRSSHSDSKEASRNQLARDELVTIFYCLWNERDSHGIYCVKQLIYEINGHIKGESENFELFDLKTLTKQDLSSVTIVAQQSFFLLQLQHEIFVIGKHFGKFVKYDAITQKSSSYKSLMISNYIPLFCCISDESIELWKVAIKNDKNKTQCKLIDVISFNQSFSKDIGRFFRFWVFYYQNQVEILFAIDNEERNIGFYGVCKMNKLDKLVMKISGSNPHQKRNNLTNLSVKRESLKKVQQLGDRLGVDKKTLYCRLWNENPKNPANIYQYLLQSHDISFIYSQLEKYMRKKYISAGELIKIMTEIEKILIGQLQEKLDIQILKYFLKCNFQKRKISLYSFNTQLTWPIFQEVYDSSIYDIIWKTIDRILYPEKQEAKKIPWNQSPNKQPQIDVQRVLQEFKLLILEDYENFLLKLLQPYKNDLTTLLSSFHFILPQYPFKNQTLKKGSDLNVENVADCLLEKNGKDDRNQSLKATLRQGVQKQIVQSQYFTPMQKIQNMGKKALSLTEIGENHNLTTVKANTKQSLQKSWFCQITKGEWNDEKSSAEYIFNELYPFYPTHEVLDLLSRVIDSTDSDWYQTKKFKKHALINTTYHLFYKKIAKIEGTKLYMFMTEYANRACYQRVHADQKSKLEAKGVKSENSSGNKNQTQKSRKGANQKGARFIEKNQENFQNLSAKGLSEVSESCSLLKVMTQKNDLCDKDLESCILYSQIHNLMITKEIVSVNTSIQELIQTTHSNLIASFFLSNKEHRIELFQDFMNFYRDKSQFYEALKEYINSENCSKVELEVLVDQLRNRQGEDCDQNSMLAELLIQGFASRIEIRDTNEAQILIKIFQSISLDLDLVLTLEKFVVICENLVPVLVFFGCDRLSYLQVLNQPSYVIKSVMENYFNKKLNYADDGHSDTLVIEGKDVCLDYIQNTYSIVLYLRQKLYIDFTEKDVSLVYGQILIEWSQFQILKQIFSVEAGGQDDEVNGGFNFDVLLFLEELVIQALGEIYSSENIYMDQQTNSHIVKILQLLETDAVEQNVFQDDLSPPIRKSESRIIVRQKAKLELAHLLERWGYSIKTVSLELMCQKWQEADRKELIEEVMTNCIEFFDLSNLVDFYSVLERTNINKQNQQNQGLAVGLKSRSELHDLAYTLAHKLAGVSSPDDNKDEEISEIICFINKDCQEHGYRVEFDLMTEVFLSCICKKYSSDPFILAGQIEEPQISIKLPKVVSKNSSNLEKSQNLADEVKQSLNGDEFLLHQDQKFDFDFLDSPKNSFLDSQRLNGQSNSEFVDRNQEYTTIAEKSLKMSDRSISSVKNTRVRSNSQGQNKRSKFKSQNPAFYHMKITDKVLAERIFNSWRRNERHTKSNSTKLFQEITKKYDWIQEAKEIIEYYSMNFKSCPEKINEMYRNNFSRQVWKISSLSTTEPQIPLSEMICLEIDSDQKAQKAEGQRKDSGVSIPLELIWDIVESVSNKYIETCMHIFKERTDELLEDFKTQYCKILYYGYHFLLMLVNNPEDCLKNVSKVSYEHFLCYEMMLELERRILKSEESQVEEIKMVNMGEVWNFYYDGLKTMIISNLTDLSPEIGVIPFETSISVLERLCSQIGKRALKLSLYFKLIKSVKELKEHYEEQEKPEIIRKLLASQFVEIIKRNSKTQLEHPAQSQNSMVSVGPKISLKTVSNIKRELMKMSHHHFGEEAEGGEDFIKQLADVFEEIRQNKDQSSISIQKRKGSEVMEGPHSLSKHSHRNQTEEEEQELQEIILQKMVSKKFLDTDGKAQILTESLKGKLYIGHEKSFESSILIEASNIDKQTISHNPGTNFIYKKTSLDSENVNLYQQKQSQSLFKMHSEENHDLSGFSDDFLENTESNLKRRILNELPKQYLQYLMPEAILKKMKRKNQLLSQKEFPQSEKIKPEQCVPGIEQQLQEAAQLFKMLQSYENFWTRKSKYNLKVIRQKILALCDKQRLFNHLLQIYFSEAKVRCILELNDKKNQSGFSRGVNKLNQQSVHEGVVRKIQQTKLSYLLELIYSLELIEFNAKNSINSELFQQLIQLIRGFEDSEQHEKRNEVIKSLLPLNDLVCLCSQQTSKLRRAQSVEKSASQKHSEQSSSSSSCAEETLLKQLFARVYEINMAIDDQIDTKLFADLFVLISRIVELFTQQTKGVESEKQENGVKSLTLSEYRNLLSTMMMWQIVRVIEPSSVKRQKLEYLIEQLEKVFLVDIYSITQEMLRNNAELQGTFNAKVIKMM